MSGARPRLGSILVSQGVITQEELERAVLFQLRAESSAGRTVLAEAAEASGGRWVNRSPRLGEALVELGICNEEQIARALALQFEVEFVDLAAQPPAPEALARIPAELARRFGVVPYALGQEGLRVAVAGPLDPAAETALREAVAEPVLLACAPESQVTQALSRYPAAVRQSLPAPELEEDAEQSPGRLIHRWIEEAARSGASDLYLEPTREWVCVRYRVNGRIQPTATLEITMLRGLISHVKMICGMELTGKPRPQDGRCRVRVDGRMVELQAYTSPGAYGETAVLRMVR